MRVWEIDAPSGAISTANKFRLSVGLFPTTSQTQAEVDENYLRRYLDDPLVIGPRGSLVVVADETDTADTPYFRRYLNDV